MAGRAPDSHVRWPVSLQQWSDVSLLHWRVAPDAIQARLPDGLTVDTHAGHAWVSLTPFRMRRARAPRLPSVPWLSNYPEWNVRTYVRGPDGRDGLWFFSLDVARLPVVVAMRASVGLPYVWSAMHIERDGDLVSYDCRRRAPGPGASSRLVVQFGPPIGTAQRTELDDWLTGRWRAYTRALGTWCVVEVVHEPWPLRRAGVVDLDAAVVEATAPIGGRAPDVVHAAEAVHARLGPPRLVRS